MTDDDIIATIWAAGGPDEISTVIEREPDAKKKVDRPKNYRVVMLNDDFTPMDFVVGVLVEVFHKGAEEAFAIMLEVHKSGRGIAGVYQRDVAETKAALAMDYARNRGHPFKCDVEPE